MKSYATNADLVQVLRVTYNGRECALVRVDIAAAGDGPNATVVLRVEALLPPQWDQGPAVEPRSAAASWDPL